MRSVVSREELRALLDRWRDERRSIALVPTMGNLHEGHLQLVRAAREAADRVVASIYVNPTQFGAGEDFERYPRTEHADQERLAGAGCDLAFLPDAATMYPFGLERATRLRAAPDLANILEGASRPGHFDGVVTVVARLFNLVSPDLAVFGEKDYQQWLVIRRLVDDLGYPLRLVCVPTVRDGAGLALSSRNRYLEPAQLDAARAINAVLRAAAERAARAGADLGRVEQAAANDLEQAGLRVDYLAVRRDGDLHEPAPQDPELRVLAAAFCGSTRLIDNYPFTRVCIPEE